MKAHAHASLGGAGVLLLGEQAEALAPRLALSGYRPLHANGGEEGGKDGCEEGGTTGSPYGGGDEPAALILSPGLEDRLPELRRRWGTRPMLLGVERDDVAGRARCLGCGASDIWFTDMGASDLLGRLRLHLHRPVAAERPPLAPPRTMPAAVQPPTAPEVSSGDLRLDPSRRRAWRGERPISLSAREHALLRLLLEHRGQVVSRERILAAVWSGEQPAASNVIEVYVRYLRRKLEEGGERRLIHTVRGQGYRLGDPRPAVP